jgi:hypothetical protein
MKQIIQKGILTLTIALSAPLFSFSQANISPAVKTIKDSQFAAGDIVILPVISYSPENLGKFLRAPSNMDTLEKVIAFLKKYPNLVVEVGCHSGYDGSDKFNQTWTDNLAKSYIAYLVEKGGLPTERFVPAGYGETKSFTPKNTLVLPSKKSIPEGTTLTAAWIESNFPEGKNKADHEFIMKQIRRIEFTILKTDFAK